MKDVIWQKVRGCKKFDTYQQFAKEFITKKFDDISKAGRMENAGKIYETSF